MRVDVPAVSGNLLHSRLQTRAFAERIPLQAEIEIIATCNFACQHCYIAPCSERNDVMSLDKARIVFDKLAAAGTMSVLLTGGEVLTHKQFRAIYLAAKRAGFFVYVNTNGYLIGEAWADFFAEWPPETISISLYGATKETYELVTGIPKAHERVYRAVDLLLERGLRLDLKCPAMTLTADELPAMQAFAESRGVSFRTDFAIVPQEKGDTAPLKLQLAPRLALELEQRIDPGLAELRTFAERRIGSLGNDVYQCGAGRTSLAINVFGGVTTCLTSRKVVGNLLEESFDQIWDTLGGKVQMKYPDNHPCATCDFRQICMGCPATVESLTGLPTGYVQQYCKATHLRAYELGYHPTGVPRTVADGIPAGIATPPQSSARALPLLSQ